MPEFPMRRKITEGPIWELKVEDPNSNPHQTTTLHVHEDALYLSGLNKLFHITREAQARRSIRVFEDVEIVTMAIEWAYNGDYTPSITDIQRMHPAVQDEEAETQFNLYLFVDVVNDSGGKLALLAELAFQRFDACRISPGMFIKVMKKMENTDLEDFRFKKWCAKWIKEYRDELLESEECEKTMVDGGHMAKALLGVLTSRYHVTIEGEVSLKRRADDVDKKLPTKAQKTGKSATITVPR